MMNGKNKAKKKERLLALAVCGGGRLFQKA